MKVMGIDVATNTGWAVYDLDQTPSGIVSGSIKLQGASAFDKVCHLRRTIPRLLKEHRPDFAAIEAPMEFAPAFKKKSKTMYGEEEQGTTINSKVIAVLNRYAGATEMAVLGQNIPCVSVAARTWQTIIPSQITGKPKQRASAYCDMLKIVSPNIDSRDACIIAIWAAGHAQEFKLLQRERAA